MVRSLMPAAVLRQAGNGRRGACRRRTTRPHHSRAWPILSLGLVAVLPLSAAAPRERVWTEAEALRLLAPPPVALDAPGATNRQASADLAPRQKRMLFAGQAAYNFLAFLPEGFADSTNRWPLIVFLHGQAMKEQVRAQQHYGPIRYGLDHDRFPFVVVAPATAEHDWRPARLEAFLASFLWRVKKIDPDRIYLTGISMGGYGAWDYATAFPQRFAAIAPACGGADFAGAAARLRQVPVWAFHGAKDPVVPPQNSTVLVQALQANGGTARLSLFPDAGHDIVALVYTPRDLYDWFLGFQRPSARARALEAGPSGSGGSPGVSVPAGTP